MFEHLSQLELFPDSFFSLHDASSRDRCEYGSALFFGSPIRVSQSRRLTAEELEAVPENVRDASRDLAVVAQVTAFGRSLMLASFHIPAAQGTRWRWQGKRGMIRAVSNVLAESREGVAGIDANGPKLDHPDLRRNVYWYEGSGQDREEYLLHDPLRAPHAYRDALRVYFDANPTELEHVASVRPDGPLAISHRRNGVACRYDFVLIRGLTPLSLPLHLDVGKASDHLPVVAELAVPHQSEQQSTEERSGEGENE